MKRVVILQYLAAGDAPATVVHSLRTTVAAVASLLVARLCGMPEAYWAAITTIIVMQSSLGAALPISVQRLAGTALGAVLGALLAMRWPANAVAFGLGILVMGLIVTALGVDRNAYRYAGITLAIVMLVMRPSNPWIVALHRFAEVGLGIAVGLVLVAIWPERVRPPPKRAPLAPAVQATQVVAPPAVNG